MASELSKTASFVIVHTITVCREGVASETRIRWNNALFITVPYKATVARVKTAEMAQPRTISCSHSRLLGHVNALK